MRFRRAPKRRAVQFISATRETPDLDLSALELSLTNTANPLIVERMPFPESISHTQDGKSIVERDIGSHSATSTLRITLKQTIGRPDD